MKTIILRSRAFVATIFVCFSLAMGMTAEAAANRIPLFTYQCVTSDASIDLCNITRTIAASERKLHIASRLRQILLGDLKNIGRFVEVFNSHSDSPAGECAKRSDIENAVFCQLSYMAEEEQSLFVVISGTVIGDEYNNIKSFSLNLQNYSR